MIIVIYSRVTCGILIPTLCATRATIAAPDLDLRPCGLLLCHTCPERYFSCHPLVMDNVMIYSYQVLLLFLLDDAAYHDGVAELLEHLPIENLGEEVCQIVG